MLKMQIMNDGWNWIEKKKCFYIFNIAVSIVRQARSTGAGNLFLKLNGNLELKEGTDEGVPLERFRGIGVVI